MSKGGIKENFLVIWDALHDSIIPTAIILMTVYCYREGVKEVRSVYLFSEHVLLLILLLSFTRDDGEEK